MIIPYCILLPFGIAQSYWRIAVWSGVQTMQNILLGYQYLPFSHEYAFKANWIVATKPHHCHHELTRSPAIPSLSWFDDGLISICVYASVHCDPQQALPMWYWLNCYPRVNLKLHLLYSHTMCNSIEWRVLRYTWVLYLTEVQLRFLCIPATMLLFYWIQYIDIGFHSKIS